MLRQAKATNSSRFMVGPSLPESLSGIALYTTISPGRGCQSILRNLRVQIPRPSQYSAAEIGHRLESLPIEEVSNLRAAAAGAADHDGFLVRIELFDAIGNLAHRNMYDLAGHRRQPDFPVLAHVEQRHRLAGIAPLEKFRRGQIVHHGQNTKPCAEVALTSGSMTVSNKLSRIHSG